MNAFQDLDMLVSSIHQNFCQILIAPMSDNSGFDLLTGVLAVKKHRFFDRFSSAFQHTRSKDFSGFNTGSCLEQLFFENFLKIKKNFLI